jgi:hypothetical protein
LLKGPYVEDDEASAPLKNHGLPSITVSSTDNDIVERAAVDIANTANGRNQF